MSRTLRVGRVRIRSSYRACTVVCRKVRGFIYGQYDVVQTAAPGPWPSPLPQVAAATTRCSVVTWRRLALELAVRFGTAFPLTPETCTECNRLQRVNARLATGGLGAEVADGACQSTHVAWQRARSPLKRSRARNVRRRSCTAQRCCASFDCSGAVRAPSAGKPAAPPVTRGHVFGRAGKRSSGGRRS